MKYNKLSIYDRPLFLQSLHYYAALRGKDHFTTEDPGTSDYETNFKTHQHGKSTWPTASAQKPQTSPDNRRGFRKANGPEKR